MANISSADLARSILDCCLRGLPWDQEALRELTGRAAHGREASLALFGILAEQLADRFEPRLCDAYVELFTRVIERVMPGCEAGSLKQRYQRIRHAPPVQSEPSTVYVLSRITLGADVAVTSVLMDAAKRRFPRARIRFVGTRKNWELFAADERVQWHEFSYSRSGSLHERLTPPRLEGGLVLDPDSRITQLGLLPVCGDGDYRFFESRAYGGDGGESISQLASRWTAEVLGIAGKAYIAPLPSRLNHAVTASFGVGENLEKRLDGEFEAEILRLLSRYDVLLDEGGSAEEKERARAAVEHSGARPSMWSGAYAPFADAISRSSLFVGYDSAGQHVAAACGVPLVCFFAGAPSDRFYHRWQPTGPGPKRVIRVTAADRHSIPTRAAGAIAALIRT